MAGKIPIIEIFGPTIQGEGMMIGQQTMFIRTGGCDFLCKMCDSLHAVLPVEIRKRATYMTCTEIFEGIMNQRQHTKWVTLSGGNPCLWDLKELVTGLHGNWIKVAVETQGTYWKDWVGECDVITVSPKGPGMGERCDRKQLDYFCTKLRYHSGFNLKIVCFEDGDLELARELHVKYPLIPLYLSVGNSAISNDVAPLTPLRNTLLTRLRWLAETVVQDPLLTGVLVLPQLHTLIWGNEKAR